MDPILQIRGLQKSYNVPVLIDFDLDLHPGEVHALVGSNGAGKTTLAKILCGLTPFNGGSLRLGDKPYLPLTKDEATRAGIVMVMQELNTIPTLSIAENLFFNELPSRFGIINQKTLIEQAREALKRVNLEQLDPFSRMGDLGVGQQQLVEIAAALTQKCRILILDEPTAALTDPEIETLFTQVKALQEEGVAILYVSHRMDEIRRIADRVSVMRDGRRINTHSRENYSQETIVREMAGKDVWSSKSTQRDLSEAPIVLEAKGLRSEPKVLDLSFQLRKGEILGLAGLVGSGRTECLRALFGVDPVQSGSIRVRGREVRVTHPKDAVAYGIGMVPEDRKSHGILLSQGLRVNATLATADLYSKFGYIHSGLERKASEEGSQRLDIKCEDVDQPVEQLSGGNQQKVVMLRWLLRDSEILLLDEPTRGIDIAAKESIYALLREFVQKGKSILLVSSELLELMSLCDRIGVFSGGRICEEFTPDNWTQEKITKAAFSAYLGQEAS